MRTIQELNELAITLAEKQDRLDELMILVKEATNKRDIAERAMTDALTEEGVSKWEIDGRKPFKLAKKRYWNIVDYGKLLEKFKNNPDICKLNGMNVRSWANEEIEAGRAVPEDYGISPYEKISISGGQIK